MSKKEIKPTIIIAILILLFIGLLFIAEYFFDLNNKKRWVSVLFLFIYLIMLSPLNSLLTKTKNETLRILINILLIPMSFIYIFLKSIYSILATFLNSAFYVAPSLILIVIIFSLKSFNAIDFSDEQGVFLLLTIVSTISVAFNKYLLKFVLKHSSIFTKHKDREDTLEMIELTKYLFKRDNIRFVIYLLYFVFLLAFSFYYLEGKSLFTNKLLDSAVLQAFLVFIAFDSVMINSKYIKLKSSIILSKMWKIFKYDVEDEDEYKQKENSNENENKSS